MDDILASIQRIITDDPSGLSAARRPRGQETAPPAQPNPADDVLELTSPVVDAAPAPVPPPPAPVASAPPEPEPAPIPVAPPITAPVAVDMPVSVPEPQTKVDMISDAAVPTDSLVSDTTARASREALASLSSMLVTPANGAATLDDLVKDLLRPLLKTWLDEKLPGMVEDLVAREIARITGREG